MILPFLTPLLIQKWRGGLGVPARNSSSLVSTILTGRRAFFGSDAVAALAERYGAGPAPLPPNWGGYRVIPQAIEFWLHRDNRLHDRIRYRRQSDGGWRIERLGP